jgi:hypothetical protein
LNLASIARVLGGEINGGQVLCPGPGHSPKDRSLSIRLDPSAPDGFVTHSFAGDDAIACRDYVRDRFGMPAFKPNGHKTERHEPEPSSQIDNRKIAQWLWERRQPITQDCPAGLYLRQHRGYHGPIPLTLGYLPANGKHSAAMIAAFGFCDEPEPGMIRPPASVTAVHLTRLTPDGQKANESRPAKIMLGPMSGLLIVLAPVNDSLGLAITEGIEDGLSVFEETGLGVWAAGSAPNLPKIAAAIPPYVECMLFAHRDNGMRFAKEAARLIAAMKVECHLKGRG